MPILTWATKTPPKPISTSLQEDSRIYPHGRGYPAEVPPNHLIWGDNLAAMWALLPEWEGRIDLIYADPPFFTNRSFTARVGRGEDSRRPREWQLADGYPDNWSSLDAYLDMLYPRLILMHRLLSPTGSLYLHLDWHANAYARLLLDEIFGPEQVLNEIVWAYHGPSPIRSAFNRKHDTILVYTKSKQYTFNTDAIRTPYDPNTVKTFGASTKAGFGKVPNLARGKVPEDWWYFPVVARLHSERTGYPTQKPEALLERIILASSNPGEVVADFFCGSGTTAVVAGRLGRRFIASDVTWRAIHTTRSRLVATSAEPFSLACTPGLSSPAPAPEAGLSARIEETGKDRQVCLSADEIAPEELDYWEIDPNWDGQVFRSAAQSVRPRKSQATARELALPPGCQPGPACLRLVLVNGVQKVFEIT